MTDTSLSHIQSLRSDINALDASLLRILGQRFSATREIGMIKVSIGMPVTDIVREHQLQAMRKIIAEEAGLDAEFCEELFALILKQSKKEQDIKL